MLNAMAAEGSRDVTTEEEDILQRSTKRSKDSHEGSDRSNGRATDAGEGCEGSGRSYRDTVMGDAARSQESQDDEEDGNTSEDDEILEGDKVTWFGMGMTKEEKIAARRPWRSCLIIKLVG